MEALLKDGVEPLRCGEEVCVEVWRNERRTRGVVYLCCSELARGSNANLTEALAPEFWPRYWSVMASFWFEIASLAIASFWLEIASF